MSGERLGRDVFLALAAVGWADGKLDADEADAIVRTAVECGLEVDEIAAIEAATRSPVTLAVVDRTKMSKADRLFVYAVASWIMRLDGTVDARELDVLRRLGDALKLPERPRAHADMIALEIAELPEGDRPARYDLVGLRRTLGERLAEAQRLRAAQGKHRLGRDVFLALAAVGWADGKLDEDEADAIVRAALEEGLGLDEIDAIEQATKAPIGLDAIDAARLGADDRFFVFAVASWMVLLDRVVHDDEVAMLKKLGDRLELSDATRADADTAVHGLARLPAGDRPARFDLRALRDLTRNPHEGRS